MKNELHPIQLQILSKLLFSSNLRYTDLRPSKTVENNSLNFHLDRLQELNLIEKSSDSYKLTQSGKEFAGRINTESHQVTKQAKISAWIACTRGEGPNKVFLIYTRLKHPFLGCQGFISGKVDYGEKVIDAARRELKEETGLTGDPQLVDIKHYRVFEKITNKLLEDKFMYLFLVKDPIGDLVPSYEIKCDWVLENGLRKYVTKPFESIDNLMRLVERINSFNGQIRFIEDDHMSETF